MSSAQTGRTTPKTAYLNIRISKQQKEVIGQAAALRKVSLSEFVIENAFEAATQVLADNTRFVLSSEKWEQFCKALDAPPKTLPALKELFSRPSPFDEQQFEHETARPHR